MSWIGITKAVDIASHLGVLPETLASARRQRNDVYVKKEIWQAKKGKARKLCYPHKDCALDIVQRAIKKKCLEGIKLCEAVRGYLKGQHNINVSQIIAGREYVAKIDIKDFHPHIRPELVIKALRSHDLSHPWCRIIAQLATFENGVPQGAATSNHIANVIIDFVLKQGILRFCQDRNVVVVNFGDDTAFAGNDRARVDECVEHAKKVFALFGLEANSKSSSAEHVGAMRKFIGTSTARARADLTRKKYREYRKELRAALRTERRLPIHAPIDKTMINSFKGKIAYVRRLNRKKARVLAVIFFRLCRVARDRTADRGRLLKMVIVPSMPVSLECPFEVV